MHSFYKKTFLSGIIVILTIFSACAQTHTFKLDTKKEYQSIDGFGASDAWRMQFVGKNWPLAKRERIAQLLFSQEIDKAGNPEGIGLSLWRFYIGAGTTEQGDASDIKNEWRRAESFIDEEGNYDWSKQEGQQWFLKKAKDAGVEKFLAFSIAAPVFWSLNGKGYAATKDGSINLKPEHYDDYSDFMVEVLAHFENEGLGFDYLSPINEPQWDWGKATQEGTPATNENIAKLVDQLNEGIKSKDLKTTITVSETADLRFMYSEYKKPGRGEQIQDFFGNSNSSAYIRDLEYVEPVISGHSYFTTWPVSSLIKVRKELQESLKKHGLAYWQSEFCILEKSEDIGQGGTRDLGMPTALYVARVMHADLTLANARSWQWWTALSQANFKDGLVYLDTGNPEDMFNKKQLKYDGIVRDSKLLWALGNYARFVRPGMKRVDINSNTNKSLEDQYRDLMLSAYKNPKNGDLVIVAINYEDKPKTIKIDAAVDQFTYAYETSADQNLGRRKLSGNTLTLAPRSVTTLTTFSL